MRTTSSAISGEKFDSAFVYNSGSFSIVSAKALPTLLLNHYNNCYNYNNYKALQLQLHQLHYTNYSNYSNYINYNCCCVNNSLSNDSLSTNSNTNSNINSRTNPSPTTATYIKQYYTQTTIQHIPAKLRSECTTGFLCFFFLSLFLSCCHVVGLLFSLSHFKYFV